METRPKSAAEVAKKIASLFPNNGGYAQLVVDLASLRKWAARPCEQTFLLVVSGMLQKVKGVYPIAGIIFPTYDSFTATNTSAVLHHITNDCFDGIEQTMEEIYPTGLQLSIKTTITNHTDNSGIEYNLFHMKKVLQ